MDGLSTPLRAMFANGVSIQSKPFQHLVPTDLNTGRYGHCFLGHQNKVILMTSFRGTNSRESLMLHKTTSSIINRDGWMKVFSLGHHEVLGVAKAKCRKGKPLYLHTFESR